ncbi:MAG TPA: 3',5'-cyclic-nucleotide phosphodiesterase [Blastocatellia bacterium]|nr:3',5'-cyclic-nucleotide phosphodiesterase [Blastocatellia bacterium]
MKIRLLPSIAGRESQLQCLTSFLIDDRLAIDGGSIGFALLPPQLGSIRHIIVTHSHNDHIASLPIYVAEAFSTLDSPIVIHAAAEVIAALREFVFNDQVAPNFEAIQLNGGSGPTLRYEEMQTRKKVTIGGIDVTPIPVNHIVPTVGLLTEAESASVLFTSDTYTTDEIWQVAKEVKNLKAVFVDVSFPNEMGELAAVSKHLTPELLASELKKLNRAVQVIAIHIKPTNRDDVVRQLGLMKHQQVSVGEIDRVYEW